jgi:hypothetical protein
MSFRRCLVTVLICALAPCAALAQSDAPPPTKLALRPAGPNVPALKFQLLPELRDSTPGNAALLYQRAHAPEWQFYRRMPGFEKLFEIPTTPLKELPRKDYDWLLTSSMLKEVDLAARREYCDWEMTPRIRTDGIGLLLPDVQGMREFGSMLAARARFHMADGHYAECVHSLQTGMALGRHIAEAPTLINALVGIAISQIMLGQVEDLIQQPNAPNMYWALTMLPRPYIDMTKSMQGERIMIQAETARFGLSETTPMTVKQQLDMLRTFRQYGLLTGPEWVGELEMVAVATKLYPRARQALIDEGRPAAEVDALPVIQVVMLNSLRHFRRYQDEMYKWWSVPYAESREGAAQVDAQLKEAKRTLAGLPFTELLPAVDKVRFASVRLDRRIAALRCVEALRLYAAAHQGKLPATLADIKGVPVPLDPVLGQPFVYQVTATGATLQAPPPGKQSPNQSNSLTYDITLQP